jgi:ABC-type Zn2+ transport system substrate-binding protein/surface adhesin
MQPENFFINRGDRIKGAREIEVVQMRPNHEGSPNIVVWNGRTISQLQEEAQAKDEQIAELMTQNQKLLEENRRLVMENEELVKSIEELSENIDAKLKKIEDKT